MSPDGRNVYVATPSGMTVLARDRASGRLRRLRGLDGCVSAGGRGGCRAQAGAGPAHAVRVSADGLNVYLLSNGGPFGHLDDSERMLIFSRNPRSGAVRPLPGRSACVASADNRNGTSILQPRARPGCAIALGFWGAQALALSADGAHVYVSGYQGITAFARDSRTGGVSQLTAPAGCVLESQSIGTSCTLAPGLSTTVHLPTALALSGDGRNLYRIGTRRTVDDSGGATATGQLVVLARDVATGALTPRSVCRDWCGPIERDAAMDMAISPDGRNLYYLGSRGIATFARDSVTGDLRAARAPERSVAVWQGRVIVPDNRTGYVVGESGIDVFRRDTATGRLRKLPAACWAMPGLLAGRCRRHTVRGVTQPQKDGYPFVGLSAAVDPTGRDLYILSGPSAAIAVLRRR